MILAIVQARMSSSRLPGKVMKPILGRPMVARQIDRLARCHRIDRLVLATSSEPSDDPLAELCQAEGWLCYRGSLNDVLGRFDGAAVAHGPAGHVVRLTADCPLIDPATVDATIERHIKTGADYTSNGLPGQRTFPNGLDVEVMTAAALARTAREATTKSNREHVTQYIYENPQLFKIEGVTQARHLGNLRWTVDTPADLEFATMVYSELLPVNPAFGQDDILALLERRPDLAKINGE